MFHVFKNRLEISGVLTTVTAIRISQGRSTEPIGSDLPVVKDSLGKPFIPGSSFKGALRSRLESFLRGILGDDRKLVANPAIEEEWSLTSQESSFLKTMDLDELVLFSWFKEHPDLKALSFTEQAELVILRREVNSGTKRPSSEEQVLLEGLPKGTELEALRLKSSGLDAALTKAISYETDLISKLFGSPWVSSKFQVRDLTVLPGTWFGQYQERDGVSIDRDTETAADGKLYDFQVVPAGTLFEFKAVVENVEDFENIGYWELGLLMIGLNQFESEQIPLGGGRSRGLGVVKLDIQDVWWVDYPDDCPEELLTYLQRLVNGQKDAHYKLTPESFAAYKTDWTAALVNYLGQYPTTRKQATAVEEDSHA